MKPIARKDKLFHRLPSEVMDLLSQLESNFWIFDGKIGFFICLEFSLMKVKTAMDTFVENVNCQKPLIFSDLESSRT